MPIDGIVVRNIVKELNSSLINGKIDKISQPEIDEMIISVRNLGRNFRLLISSSPSYPRVHLTEMQKQNPISAPMFCMVLRKHLSGGKIVKIEQYNIDRVVKIFIENYDELGNLSNKILICEIMGRHSNIILVNENTGEVIDSIKHITPDMSSYRQILPGLKYIYPPAQDKLNPLNIDTNLFRQRLESSPTNMKLGKFLSQVLDGINIFAAREICYNSGVDEDFILTGLDEASMKKITLSLGAFTANVINNNFSPCIYYDGSNPRDFYSMKLNCLSSLIIENDSSISRIIELFYYNKDKLDRSRQKSSDILRVINNNLDRCLKKLSIQEEKLLECRDKDRWRLYGDLIMANMYNIKKGDSKAILTNYYDEKQGTIEISLDMQLTPAQNAQAYYKKYNKEKNAELMVGQQKKENLEEIGYLENQLVNLNNCTEGNEIEEIRNELASLGYMKIKRGRTSQKQKLSKPIHYLSSDGFDIYVGKNNIQNDYLTTKFADPSDIWLHTKNIPGSHVIIKQSARDITDTAISEAAALSAYYSKARNSSNVPVDYTQRKNVKKPSGSKPGMVIYYTNKTIYITPDEDLIRSIKQVE